AAARWVNVDAEGIAAAEAGAIRACHIQVTVNIQRDAAWILEAGIAARDNRARRRVPFAAGRIDGDAPAEVERIFDIGDIEVADVDVIARIQRDADRKRKSRRLAADSRERRDVPVAPGWIDRDTALVKTLAVH